MHAGGGGPKAELLQKMIAEEGLESRVHMVGPVPHEKARDLLVSASCTPGCFCLHRLAPSMTHVTPSPQCNSYRMWSVVLTCTCKLTGGSRQRDTLRRHSEYSCEKRGHAADRLAVDKEECYVRLADAYS